MPSRNTRTAPFTVDGTTTTAVWKLRGSAGPRGCKIVFLDITGLQGVVTLSYDGGVTYLNIECVDSAGNSIAAGGTITAADGLAVFVPAAGATHIKFTRSAGSGPLIFVEQATAEELAAFMGSTGGGGGGGATDTEFPPAAALADDTANPTTTSVAAMGMIFDGSTWDRWRGEVIPRASLREVTLTFSPDTSILASGDVIADSQILASVVRANDSKGWLVAFDLTDEDDNTAIDMDLVLLSANVSMGTENSPISISDANARNILGVIRIAVADWNDHINSKMASIGNRQGSMLALPITPVSGADDIYVALVCRSGTPTYTGSGITARFWFLDAN